MPLAHIPLKTNGEHRTIGVAPSSRPFAAPAFVGLFRVLSNVAMKFDSEREHRLCLLSGRNGIAVVGR